ncbi:NRDE family protein [Chryseomicrobium sp. FSL W7-1435]|uniref:NRDE family protein n=1 Tax=Chryseomicrobium sp. FSL W7-1435 TaxID=2921704 RepID=UPI00315A4C0A
MCLIAFHLQQHPTYAFIMAANRDEFYDRPTQPAHFWEEHHELLAGKDLLAGGTWLGITKSGRMAALTNYRDPLSVQQDLISRGEIVKEFLTSKKSSEEFMATLDAQKTCYNGFNLLLGTFQDIHYYSNMTTSGNRLEEGTHALSNKFLNTPWPKVDHARNVLSEYVATANEVDIDFLFSLMQRAEQAPDHQLPDTGVGLDLERKLSPLFIQMPNYGTRSTTVILVTHEGQVTFEERTYTEGQLTNSVSHYFQLTEKSHSPAD